MNGQCDHIGMDSVLINYIEIRCKCCGQIVAKVKLEGTLAGNDKIVMT